MGAKKDPKKDAKTPSKTPKKKEGAGGKAKKKKWSKGKTRLVWLLLTLGSPYLSRDKLNNLVLFDKGTYDKLYKEVPTYKLITPSIVSERLKVSCFEMISLIQAAGPWVPGSQGSHRAHGEGSDQAGQLLILLLDMDEEFVNHLVI